MLTAVVPLRGIQPPLNPPSPGRKSKTYCQQSAAVKNQNYHKLRPSASCQLPSYLLSLLVVTRQDFFDKLYLDKVVEKFIQEFHQWRMVEEFKQEFNQWLDSQEVPRAL